MTQQDRDASLTASLDSALLLTSSSLSYSHAATTSSSLPSKPSVPAASSSGHSGSSRGGGTSSCSFGAHIVPRGSRSMMPPRSTRAAVLPRSCQQASPPVSAATARRWSEPSEAPSLCSPAPPGPGGRAGAGDGSSEGLAQEEDWDAVLGAGGEDKRSSRSLDSRASR